MRCFKIADNVGRPRGNKPIPVHKQEKIAQLSDKNASISYIAKESGTCRPTVRKYIKLNEQGKLPLDMSVYDN